MTAPCPKCQGTGEDTTKLAVRAKVPNTLPGLPRYKLVSPLCDLCGGSGEREEIGLTNDKEEIDVRV